MKVFGKTLIYAIFNISLIVMSSVNLVNADSGACDKDASKYCPVFKGSDPRKYYCLKQVETQLSPGCKEEVGKYDGSQNEYIQDCVADFHKFCSTIVPGEGRLKKCLKEHSKELTFECKKRLG